jgi:hypothetical protein
MTATDLDTTVALRAAAVAVLQANAAKAAADAADKAAKAAFKNLAQQATTDTVTVHGGEYDGAKVSLVIQPRRTYDADALKGFVGTEVTRGAWLLATDRVIDPKAFAELVRIGRIGEAVADKVTNVTEVTKVVATVPKQ